MAASVLNTKQAVEVGVYVVRAFIQLRDLLSVNKQLAARLSELERKFTGHDRAIADIIIAIRNLMVPPQPKKAPIGFVRPKEP